LDEFDRLAGVKWHGVPEGGTDDTWEARFRFRSDNPYQSQFNLTQRILENRIVHMVPYPSDKTPPEGPKAIDVRQRVAQAIAVKIFSPVSSDYGGHFALVYGNRAQVAAIVRSRMAAGGGFFNWFSR